MKRLKYGVFILILFVVVLYWKKKNGLHVDFFPYWGLYSSDSLAESRGDGSYVATYVPVKSEYRLRSYGFTIKLDTAWVQHYWHEKTIAFFFVRKELGKSLIVTFPFQKSIDTNFLFSVESISGIVDAHAAGGSQRSRAISGENVTDTIRLHIIERNPIDSIGFKSPISGDTIIYIRKR